MPATRVLLHQSTINERVTGIKQVRLAEAVRLIWASEFGRPSQASARHLLCQTLDSLFELSQLLGESAMGLIVQASVVEHQDAVVIVCSDQLRQSIFSI